MIGLGMLSEDFRQISSFVLIAVICMGCGQETNSTEGPADADKVSAVKSEVVPVLKDDVKPVRENKKEEKPNAEVVKSKAEDSLEKDDEVEPKNDSAGTIENQADSNSLSAFIKEGSVFLNDHGKIKRIALGTDDGMSMGTETFKIGNKVLDGHFNLRMYEKTLFSPDQRYIALEAKSWETRTLDVYDLKKDRLHIADTDLPIGMSSKLQWLPDSRLSLIGGCKVDQGCMLLESKSAKKPWKLKKIKKVKD